ncbi:MAG TPA: TIGR03936 family radical SAM-associated protein [Mycobacteriales bacterium]|nr:TIGR03936 family radical SAM-associated protein [Mycobacteriales bacterium]
MGKQRTPDGPPPPPVVQRLRLRYAKRGRLRFTSHRDFARAFERALRRAAIPMAYSAGFSPHPKVSWVNATPTGVASEAEYVEIALAERRVPEDVRRALDSSLPAGLDVLACVEAPEGGPSIADRVTGSAWEIHLPDVDPAALERALARFLAADEVPVERRTKDGVRRFDARAPVQRAVVGADRHARSGTVSADGAAGPCAILRCVVRHVTPAVRPDDILSGLRSVDPELELSAPAEARRLAQGLLDEDGHLADPLDDVTQDFRW